MNTFLLWALPLAGVLALAGWAVLRRRNRQDRQDRQAVPPRPPEATAAAAPPATADAAHLAAQHQAATEALRQARRRKAEDEARRASELAAQPPMPPAAQRPPPKPVADPARAAIARPPPPRSEAAADPVVPVLSPLAIQRNTARTVPTAGLAPLRTPARPPGPPTVLVVDDSKVVRVKTGRLFEKQGWRVLLADDGQAALACLEGDTPDLLITDVEMPGLDGFALTRRLRGQPRWAGLPVVMITSSDDKHRAEAAAAGVDVLLGKPYADEALLAQAQVLVGAGAARGAPVLH